VFEALGVSQEKSVSQIPLVAPLQTHADYCFL